MEICRDRSIYYKRDAPHDFVFHMNVIKNRSIDPPIIYDEGKRPELIIDTVRLFFCTWCGTEELRD